MKPTTTPGPWHVQAGRAICDARGNVVASGMAWRHIEAGDVRGKPDTIEPTEADNNAHLLAAAPELLDALERAESFLSGFEDCARDEYPQMLPDVRAAIAKAKRT